MPSRHFNVLRLALVAFAGALILEVLLTFAVGLREAFTLRQVPAHLAALLVGALAGWLFELFREMTEATVETLSAATKMQTSFETLTERIKYQDRALNMLLRCPRHNDALSLLLRASLSENFRNIPLVGAPAYLAFLRRAIAHSEGYEGIQRKPISWFRDTGGGAYLTDLKRRAMVRKVRLFIIDEEDMAQWKSDLQDQDCLDYYWEHTGGVATYWMTADDFRRNFPGWETVPKDLALYDRELYIAYDQRSGILSFDVVNDSSLIVILFKEIEELAKQQLPALRMLKVTA